jgi:glycine hydroxymethyltransferase
MKNEILTLVEKHEQWRGKETINLIPSENVTSPAVRMLLSSELGHRYTSPDKFYMGTRFIDEIQQYGEQLAKDVFNCELADLRPLSGHIADLTFLASFTKPGDKVVCISRADGGYPGMSQRGIASALGLRMLNFPFSEVEMNIKIDEAESFILKEKPRVVIFGASRFLFPHPVRQLAKVAKEVGAHVGYDGSHVLGLIAGKQFQDPLREGASTLFGSTHKSFFGPQGGIIAADKEHGEVIRKRIHPAYVDNAHWNRIAALSLALAEMKEFGRVYARQVIQNAQVLAKTLAEEGFPVASPNSGYTKSHQVFLNFGGYKSEKGRALAKKLEKANIIVDSGVRLGVCEATRRGMRKEEMLRIADFIDLASKNGKKPNEVKRDVVKFMKDFQEISFCFQ